MKVCFDFCTFTRFLQRACFVITIFAFDIAISIFVITISIFVIAISFFVIVVSIFFIVISIFVHLHVFYQEHVSFLSLLF